MRTSRGYLPVKTAMKKEQVRERERYRRKTRCSGPFTRKKVPTRPPNSTCALSNDRYKVKDDYRKLVQIQATSMWAVCRDAPVKGST